MSYTDCYDIFEKAMEDPAGIRIPFDTEAAAKHYRMRMHNARAVDRRENIQTYDKGHPMHGQSSYDILTLTIKIGEDATAFLYIEPKNKHLAIDEIEKLSEIESTDEEPVDATHQS
jgi:hypothetical protein